MSLSALLGIRSEFDTHVELWIDGVRDPERTEELAALVSDLSVLSMMKQDLERSHEAIQSYADVFDNLTSQFYESAHAPYLELACAPDKALFDASWSSPAEYRAREEILEAWRRFSQSALLISCWRRLRPYLSSREDRYEILRELISVKPDLAPYPEVQGRIKSLGQRFLDEGARFETALKLFETHVENPTNSHPFEPTRASVLRHARSAVRTCEELIKCTEELSMSLTTRLQEIVLGSTIGIEIPEHGRSEG